MKRLAVERDGGGGAAPTAPMANKGRARRFAHVVVGGATALVTFICVLFCAARYVVQVFL
jgi:hypothetical protein